MKNYLDSKLSHEVKEIIGSAIAKHRFPSHNQTSSQQLFNIIVSNHSCKASYQTGKVLARKEGLKKELNCLTGKENQSYTSIRKESEQ
jgi:hypothetical protein